MQAQHAHIFVTSQIVDEVRRNKVAAAADFLEKTLNVSGPSGLPLLFGKKTIDAMTKKLKAFKHDIPGIKTELEELAVELLKQISRSEDDVSKALERLFAKPVEATEEEMKRAHARKETGRAPGKAKQALGDQINCLPTAKPKGSDEFG